MTVLNRALTGALVTASMAWVAVPAIAQEITVAIASEPSTLDPQQRDDGAERAINDNIYETLMIRTAEGDLEPGLAASAPKQIDEVTWEFDLREGVTFTNGEPFNADSVVASVERIIAPDFNSEQMAYFGTVSGAEKVDDDTVRILTSTPDPQLPSRMYWMKMVPAEYGMTEEIGSQPVGTGPYMMESWTRGEEIVLVANPDYWGEQPAVQKATFRFVSEPGTRLSGLLAGELDLITNLFPEFVNVVPKSAAVMGLETSVMILSTENGVMADERVREALNISVDRQALADSLFLGYATPVKGQLVNPQSFGFNADLPEYEYDIEKARQLVEEAGAVGETVTLVGESGRWLKDRELIEAVGAYWAETGLNVDVRIEEWGEYLNQLFDQNQRPDAIFVANSEELLDADRSMTFGLEAGASAASNADAEMAEMITAARGEIDEAKRLDLYKQISGKANELDYLVPLMNQQDIYGMSERLEWQPRRDAKLLLSEMVVAE